MFFSSTHINNRLKFGCRNIFEFIDNNNNNNDNDNDNDNNTDDDDDDNNNNDKYSSRQLCTVG